MEIAFEYLKQKRISHPDIEHRKARFMERMRQLMIYRKDEWPFEYEYWKKCVNYEMTIKTLSKIELLIK
jgi:hypothetical protein